MTLANSRLATPADARAIAALHIASIEDGFLTTLGEPVLRPLYRRVVLDPTSFAFVAGSPEHLDGFVAVATDLRALYRTFALRDGPRVALRAAPHLFRNRRRVLETLRYGVAGSEGPLPAAEVISVGVAERARGYGLGTQLVHRALDELARRGHHSARVVAGAGNLTALSLYERCGFARAGGVEVHAGTASEVLVWS